jgi:hypothetical protein
VDVGGVGRHNSQLKWRFESLATHQQGRRPRPAASSCRPENDAGCGVDVGSVGAPVIPNFNIGRFEPHQHTPAGAGPPTGGVVMLGERARCDGVDIGQCGAPVI